MPIHVQAPNGDVVVFPDGTPDDVMASAMRQTYADSDPDEKLTPYQRATAGMGYGPAPSTPSAIRTPEQDQALLRLGPQGQDSIAGADGSIGAALTGAVQGMPIVGPALLSGEQKAAAGLASLSNGKTYDQNLQSAQDLTIASQGQHPNFTTGGEIVGAVAPLAAVGSYGLGARALGMEGGSLGARVAASTGSGAAIGSADTAARGGDIHDIGWNGLISGGIGGGIPLAGAGIKAAYGAIADRIAPQLNALLHPETEAARRVGTAYARDAAANPSSVMNATDELGAQAAGIPIVNADRGGEVTRALVRSVANQSPEARQVITKVADDRFASQSQRAVDFVKKVAGGNVDDLAYQDAIQSQARAVNDPAYKAAFAHPNAQSLFTPGLQELMQSPSMRAAIDAVPTRSADRGAVQGFKEIANPFSKNSQGAYVLRQDANGTLISPNLQFWNQAKINLDSQIGAAKRAGDRGLTSDLMGLKTKLLGELDHAVPEYQTARQGAAGFFGAENALDAGKAFANQPRSIPEATRAYAKFTAPQQKAFMVGHASELIDKIKASADRSNVINSIFKNQASRDSLNLVYGPQKARQLEAYVRVEDLADRLRGALGNSTTARQLMEMGIGAGIGGAAGQGLTGDWKTGAILGAVGTRAGRYIGSKADTQVYESMAKLLTQNSPGALQAAVQIAAQKPTYMQALEHMGGMLAAPSRGLEASFGNAQGNQ